VRDAIGMHRFPDDAPPTLTLPLKGGGNAERRVAVPPPLRGRVGWRVLGANSCFALVLAATVLSAAPVPPAWGQAKDPVALAKAKELLAVSDLVAMRDQMVYLVEAQIAALVLEANPGEEEKVDRAVADLIRPSLKRRMPEYLDLAAGIYADHFTRNELDQLLAFYKSPLGQKLKREQDKLVPAISEMARTWVNRVGNDVLKDASQGLLKRGLQPPGA
jgi:uncharacterized protein